MEKENQLVEACQRCEKLGFVPSPLCCFAVEFCNCGRVGFTVLRVASQIAFCSRITLVCCLVNVLCSFSDRDYVSSVDFALLPLFICATGRFTVEMKPLCVSSNSLLWLELSRAVKTLSLRNASSFVCAKYAGGSR